MAQGRGAYPHAALRPVPADLPAGEGHEGVIFLEALPGAQAGPGLPVLLGRVAVRADLIYILVHIRCEAPAQAHHALAAASNCHYARSSVRYVSCHRLHLHTWHAYAHEDLVHTTHGCCELVDDTFTIVTHFPGPSPYLSLKARYSPSGP